MHTEEMTLLTPEEYVRTHEITLKLKSFGVTEEQLQCTAFRNNNRDWPFEQWSFGSAAEIPEEAIPFLRAYCALKWLVLEKPPHSRDKEDAWRLVAETTAARTLEIGEKSRGAQQQRAKKPRGKISDDGTTIDEVIRNIALHPKNRDLTAKELWPQLYAVLDEIGAAPIEIGNLSRPDKWVYEYHDVKDRKKSIGFGRFTNLVSKARNEK